MTALLYYLFIWPLTLLPFRVLYVISDVLYLVIYQLFGYRKEVVRKNLKNSFPEKTGAELKAIEKKFYHHLCDLLVESLKLFTVSEGETRRRFHIVNPEMANKYFDQGKSILIVAGHYGNWEYAVTIGHRVKHQITAAFTPIKNKFFNRKMKESRSRFGVCLFPSQETRKYFERKHNIPQMVTFIADQSPRASAKKYWMRFMNQDTAVLTGPETYSRKYNLPVVFGNIQKVKRGYYTLTFETLVEHPGEAEKGEIVTLYMKRLEAQIKDRPEYWLWSHNRWKLKKTDDAVVYG